MPARNQYSGVETVTEPEATMQETTKTEVRRLFRLFSRMAGTTFDVGLLVVGSALVALAAVVLLDGFEFFDVGLTNSIGETLGSGLVIVVFGAFALGVAVEGPIRASAARAARSDVEVVVVRVLSLLMVGGVLLLIGRIASPFLDDLPHTLGLAVDVLIAAGAAGLTVTAILGAATLWGVRRLYADRPWLDQIELPVLYVLWVIGTVVVHALMFGA